MFVCLSVYSHDMPKPDAARIIKLEVEMFHHESWNLIYFGVKRSKVKVNVRGSCRIGSSHYVLDLLKLIKVGFLV